MPHKPQLEILLVCISLSAAGCGDTHASVAPSPVPQSMGLQPTVIAITPNTGTTAGGAWGTISGSQFQSGATVRLGNGTVQTLWVRDEATILFYETPSHPAETVDVIVTNPGGLSSHLAGAYTFALPDSFDFTGDWIGHAGTEYEADMRFAIRNNALVSLACGSAEAVTLSPPPSVHAGEFSFLGDDGIAISGRLVSPSGAVGTINVPGCSTTRWFADKSGAIDAATAR